MEETEEMQVWSLGQQDLLEGMATYSRSLDWRIPGTEKPSGLQSTWSKASDMTEVTWHAGIYGEEMYSTELFIYIN